VPPDHHFYAEKSREVMAILDQFSPVVEQNSIDEAWLDMTGCEGLFGPPQVAARKIMQAIDDQLGLWCSIGISDNKFLAKMASEIKKPQGITELRLEDVPRLLWPQSVRTMYGIGGKTAERLERLGIRTIGELARIDHQFLVQAFGKAGDEMHRHANGIDESPVQTHRYDDAKSIGRSTTLPEDVNDLAKAKLVILELAGEVGRRARRAGSKGQTVQITLKYTDFRVVTRQATIEPTWSTDVIYQAGCALLDQNWDPARPVRLLGISLSGFGSEDQPRQMSMFDQTTTSNQTAANLPSASNQIATHQHSTALKREQLDKAVDDICAKHGAGKITRAALIREEPSHKPKQD
jgi:DNA polymerase-4